MILSSRNNVAASVAMSKLKTFIRYFRSGKTVTLFFILICYLSSITIHPIQAISFNPNYIISNHELTDYQAINHNSIQKFLDSKPGVLGFYKTTGLDDQTKSSAEIIYQASQRHKINPQVLLALLQKEQSLIENPNPSWRDFDWATGFGVCDSCSTEDPKIAKFKGFTKQIDKAAEIFRWYLEEYEKNSSDWLHQIGRKYQIDGYEVVPLNLATACLYNYTPHWNGNFNFWKIWNKWFAKIYPDGTLLQEKGRPGVWLIQWGKRRPFISQTAFLSGWNPKKIIQVDQVDLERYEIGTQIKFPNYSLLRSPGGTVYLLVDSHRRGISSREVFRKIGFNPEEIIDLEWSELDDYPEIEPISLSSIYPTGALLQDKITGGVWYVKNGIKQPLIDRSILEINFGFHFPVTPADPSELNQYPSQAPIKIKDGELITSPKTSMIYVISSGQKLPILSPSSFTALGYKWENVITVPDKVLQLHPTGLLLSVVR
jgi:hypothetical protein